MFCLHVTSPLPLSSYYSMIKIKRNKRKRGMNKVIHCPHKRGSICRQRKSKDHNCVPRPNYFLSEHNLMFHRYLFLKEKKDEIYLILKTTYVRKIKIQKIKTNIILYIVFSPSD